jgi:peptide alpha-N-acetyltransferase
MGSVGRRTRNAHSKGITLVEKAISTMQEHGATEVILEAEVTNKGALRLYQKLGFIRDKRLYR